MCEMVRYLLGTVVVLITMLAALLAHKLRSPGVVADAPTMQYTRPSAADLLMSPPGSDGDPGEVIELTALPLKQNLANR